MNKTGAIALLGAIATVLLLASPAFAQTVGVGTGTGVSVGISPLGDLLGGVGNLLNGLLIGVGGLLTGLVGGL